MDNLPILREILPAVNSDWVYTGNYTWERDVIPFISEEFPSIQLHYTSPIEYLTVRIYNPMTKGTGWVQYERDTRSGVVKLLDYEIEDYENST